MELTEVKAIDTMCRAGYAGIVTAEEWKDVWANYESRACVKGTFGGVLKKMGIPEEDGWKVVAGQYKTSVEEMIKEMDAAGVEKAFVDQQYIWSRRENKMATGFELKRIVDLVEKGKGRIVGGAGYNPWRIEESLKDIETAVKEPRFQVRLVPPQQLRAEGQRRQVLSAVCQVHRAGHTGLIPERPVGRAPAQRSRPPHVCR